MKNLTQLRQTIDSIDQKMIKLLGQRQSAVKLIGQLKHQSKPMLPISDAKREHKIFKKINSLAKQNRLSTNLVEDLWTTIFHHSRNLQAQSLKIKLVHPRQKISVGIIGFGRFGRLLTQILLHHFKGLDVKVFHHSRPKLGRRGKITFVTLKQAASSQVVILAVPMSAFEAVIKQIKPLVKPKSLIVDVCTVKSLPVKIMKQHLPKNVFILATHPLWGPDSATSGLVGLKTLLVKVRLPKRLFSHIKTISQTLGMEIVELSPEEHDRLLARSQALTHLIGKALQRMNIISTPIDTQGFKQLLKIQQFVINDTDQLFWDMHTLNPYAQSVRRQFLHALKQIELDLKEKT